MKAYPLEMKVGFVGTLATRNCNFEGLAVARILALIPVIPVPSFFARKHEKTEAGIDGSGVACIGGRYSAKIRSYRVQYLL